MNLLNEYFAMLESGDSKFTRIRSAAALPAPAVLCGQPAPADAQEAAAMLLPKGTAGAKPIAMKSPAAAQEILVLAAARLKAWGIQKASLWDTAPAVAVGDADSIAAQAAEHPGAIPAAAVLPGYAAGGTSTGAKKPVCLVGLHGGTAADGTLLRQQSRLTAREAAAAAPQPTEEAAFAGAVDGTPCKAAAKPQDTVTLAAAGRLEQCSAVKLQKGGTAESSMGDRLTAVCLAGLALMPDWDNPVRQGDSLYIPQSYLAAQSGSRLEVK